MKRRTAEAIFRALQKVENAIKVLVPEGTTYKDAEVKSICKANEELGNALCKDIDNELKDSP